MYSIQQYVKDNISFTNSLIIKFSGISYVKNKELTDVYGLDIPNNANEYKYYLNLSGVKHSTNNEVLINILEDNTSQVLTKELLLNNEYTNSELLKFTTYYNDLITEYPNDVDYIRGCILPVDIDTAINAKDGTILNYSKMYVQDNELVIVRYLESYIQSFFVRWYIPEYLITDELYAASIVGSLLPTIPQYIMNLRLELIKTNQVHDFHLEHFFRSRLNIWTELTILSKSTIIWLYNNLDYLIYNLGKNETINLIGSKVLDSNNIGMGVYRLKNGAQALINSNVSTDNNILKADNYLQITAMNDSYIVNDSETLGIGAATELQLIENDPFNVPSESTYIYNDYVVSKLEAGNIDDQNTKILDIDYGTLTKIYGSDLFLTYMDTWLVTATDKTFITILEYIDPNTKQSYRLDTITGYYLILYHMLAISDGLTTPVNYVYHTSSINYGITIDELTSNLYNKTGLLPIATEIHSKIPKLPNAITNVDTFNTLLKDIKKLLISTWVLDSNVNNASVSSGVKHMVRRLNIEGRYLIPNTTGSTNITTVLSSLGVNIDLTETYDHFNSLNVIFKLFTGNELSDSIEYKKNSEIIKSLVKKLTSYTVDVVSSINDSEALYSPYSTIESHVSDNGLINVTKASVKSPYEQLLPTIKATGDDFRESMKISVTSSVGENSNLVPMKSYFGYDKLSNEEITILNILPVTSVETINSYVTLWGPSIDTITGDDFIERMNVVVTEPTVLENSILVPMINYGGNHTIINGEVSVLDLSPVASTETVNASTILWFPSIESLGGNNFNETSTTTYIEESVETNVDVTNTLHTTIGYVDVPDSNIKVDTVISPNTIIEID